MTFLDRFAETRFGSTITAAANDGLKKASEIKDTANITMDIRKRESDIYKMYVELGKAYYKEHKKDEAPEFSQILAINAAFEEIEDLKATMENIRGVKRCPKCGAAVSSKAKFCESCGSVIESEESIYDEDDDVEAEEEAVDTEEEAAEAEVEVVDASDDDAHANDSDADAAPADEAFED